MNYAWSPDRPLPPQSRGEGRSVVPAAVRQRPGRHRRPVERWKEGHRWFAAAVVVTGASVALTNVWFVPSDRGAPTPINPMRFLNTSPRIICPVKAASRTMVSKTIRRATAFRRRAMACRCRIYFNGAVARRG